MFLKRAKHKSSPRKWAPPAGHIREGESDYFAAIRELKEETHIVVDDVEYVGTFYEGKFEVHMYHKKIEGNVSVMISKEHDSFAFVNKDTIKKQASGAVPLRSDLDKPQKLDDYTAVTQYIISQYLVNGIYLLATNVNNSAKIKNIS